MYNTIGTFLGLGLLISGIFLFFYLPSIHQTEEAKNRNNIITIVLIVFGSLILLVLFTREKKVFRLPGGLPITTFTSRMDPRVLIELDRQNRQ